MKKYLMLLTIACCFADNMDMFNQAKQVGQQNQFKLNLNSGSTFDSYGQTNKFESVVANSANSGNANAKDMYTKTYGDGNNQGDPNYLYRAGQQDIANCQNQNDPRCTTLNKYGDKDTQTLLQSYMQGFSQEYYITVKPDPTNSSCSTVTRQVQESQVSTCISSANLQYSCNSSISINLNYSSCNPNNGSCNAYAGNSQCQQTAPYVAPGCAVWKYGIFVEDGCNMGLTTNKYCNAGTTISVAGVCHEPAITVECGSVAYQSMHYGNRIDTFRLTPVCDSYNQEQLAQYACRVSSYSDGCSGFK